MKYTSQHCCDKTMDNKMALHRECCFSNYTNHGKTSYFRRFLGDDRPPWIEPWFCWASTFGIHGCAIFCWGKGRREYPTVSISVVRRFRSDECDALNTLFWFSAWLIAGRTATLISAFLIRLKKFSSFLLSSWSRLVDCLWGLSSSRR